MQLYKFFWNLYRPWSTQYPLDCFFIQMFQFYKEFESLYQPKFYREIRLYKEFRKPVLVLINLRIFGLILVGDMAYKK